MIHIKTVFMMLSLLGASVALADPGTGSGTGLKSGVTTSTTTVQTSPVGNGGTGLGK